MRKKYYFFILTLLFLHFIDELLNLCLRLCGKFRQFNYFLRILGNDRAQPCNVCFMRIDRARNPARRNRGAGIPRRSRPRARYGRVHLWVRGLSARRLRPRAATARAAARIARRGIPARRERGTGRDRGPGDPAGGELWRRPGRRRDRVLVRQVSRS